MNFSFVVGNGKHRRLLVDSAPSKDSDESSQLLRDAVIYLSNALFLLSSHQKQSGNFSDGPTERMEPGGDVAGDVVPAPIEQETDVCEVLSFDEVETFIHLLLAYGNLGLKNFAVAHRFASVVLLKDGTVLKASDRELAYTYLCEAQVGMGAASEVDIDTLAMDATNGSNRITKLSLKAMVQVARGDLEGALRTYSQACSFAPTDATIVKGLIYTYLRLGKTREARLLSEKLCAL